MGYSKVLVETGFKFLNNLLKKKLIQEIYIFKSSTKIRKKWLKITTQ